MIFRLGIVTLLLTGMLMAACAVEPAVRLSVAYPEGMGHGVTLVWRNISPMPLTLQYNSLPITRVVSTYGEEAPMTVDIDMALMTGTLPPGGEKALTINPAAFYFLTPGEMYQVTVSGHIKESNSDVQGTFLYLQPATNPTFTGWWTTVAERLGMRARLLVTLFPAERRSEARVEFQNDGAVKTLCFDREMLNAEVRQDGSSTPLKPDGEIMLKMAPAKTLQLPRFATIGLPVEQYNDPDRPIPAGRISLWLGNRQFLLQPGSKYRIAASAYLPSAEGKPPLEVKLRPFEFIAPGKAPVPAAVEQPVRISIHDQGNNPPQVCFTNEKTSALTFLEDEFTAVDQYGFAPQTVTSSRPPGLWLRKTDVVPANGAAAFAFHPHHFAFTSGEWYIITGHWKLQDAVTKTEYAVSATFPYLAPTRYPSFRSRWAAVENRPGLELRKLGTLCPATRLVGVYAKWEPPVWVEYHNTGTTPIPLFDYPTLKPRVRRDNGEEVTPWLTTVTGISNIEMLSLPSGATLRLAVLHNELFEDAKVVPENVRSTLCFDNAIFPLVSRERYTLDGTILLPDDEKKPLEASFRPVLIIVPLDQ